ncbi:hypothetical protein [Sphingomonas sp.]|uniref:hypothetical protein n=1 Tax=Sphingomonas sp. TaxID=28214 RepID=UPI003B00BD98
MQEAKFDLQIDQITHVVRAKCSGFWSLDEARKYLEQLADAISRARVCEQGARVLIDNSTASVQALVAIDEIGKVINRVYAPTDRLAIIVGSQLLKRQMDRLPKVAMTRIFTNLDDADDWLLSNDPA